MNVETPLSQSWCRQCSRCFSVFFEGDNNRAGVCIGGTGHSATSKYLSVYFAGKGFIGQENWRFCFKCEVLFFNGHPTKGFCPADAGWHNSHGSENHLVEITTDRSLSDWFGWRWCHKCEQLFFCPDEKGVTACPTGGMHSKDGSGFYFVPWGAAL